jgi:hypothetical protein
LKFPFVLLTCFFVTLNSAFAMIEEKYSEEGPYGETNARFLLRKSTILDHFEKPERRPPLTIAGEPYDLRGSIGSRTSQMFKDNPSIQWVKFRNHAARPLKPCEHWSYFLRPKLRFDTNPESPTFGQLNLDIDDFVNIELHKDPIYPTISPCSSSSAPSSSVSSSAPSTSDVAIVTDRKTSTPSLDDLDDSGDLLVPSLDPDSSDAGELVPLLIRKREKPISYRSRT